MKNLNDVKNYWDSRPCNIKHSDKPIGSKEYFDEVEARKYFVESHIPKFAEFEKWKNKKVLEIGCGIGTDTINFAKAGAQVTAVELSKESIAIAQKRVEIYGLNNVKFYLADAENLSSFVPIEKYDLIYSFGVIHHTPNPEKAISEIKKYMGENSILKLMLYHRNCWKVMWMILKYSHGTFWKMNELIPKYSEAQTGCPVTYAYTKKSVKKLLTGLEIKDAFIEHIFPYSIPEYKKYEYKKVWYFRYVPKPIFRWLEKNFGWHLCVTAKLKK
jgi:ubiquinone/menaquinone biosynthesis C-methylase UbiE